MNRFVLASAALGLTLAARPLPAATVTDPVGDFLPTYTVGPKSPDLDVTSFTVNYNSTTQQFLLAAALAGNIDANVAGLYAIGVNTGTGPNAPFADVGQPFVRFNQVIAVQKTGATNLAGVTAAINGNSFALTVPFTLLPTTGFAPEDYGFNLWPRSALGANNNVISDFAPENATISAAGRIVGVPEPATWAMMLFGFGAAGYTLRKRNRASLQAA